jgi:hypothetical protein
MGEETMNLPRRSFLKTTGAAATVAFTSGKALGANNTIRVGVVGLNGRGRSHGFFSHQI